MAQHWFDASDSSFAALFTELQITGGKSAPTSSTVNGLPALNWGGNFNSTFFLLNSLPDLSPSETWEVLVRCCINDDDATNNIGPAGLLQGSNGDATGYLADRTYTKYAWLRRYKNNSVSNLASSSNVTTVSVTMLEWIWMRLRHEPQGDGTVQLSVKLWKNGEAEPGAYSVTYNDSAANLIGSAGKPGIFVRDSANAYLNAVSVGTGGDPAPTEAVGPTDPRLSSTIENGSEVSPALQVAGVAPIQLSATLEQVGTVSAISNFFQYYFVGFWNPGTERDGVLRWPYELDNTLNPLKLQDGKIVLEDIFSSTRGKASIPLDPYRDGGDVSLIAGAKFDLADSTEGNALQIGFESEDPYVKILVQVGNGSYIFILDTGIDFELDSGPLPTNRGILEVSYERTSGNASVSLNGSLLSAIFNDPGHVLETAFFQIGPSGLAFFEEHLASVWPSAQTQLARYISHNFVVAGQESEALASLQVGAGRRLVTSVEQGSALVAAARLGLSLDATSETQSQVLGSATIALPLSVTLEQSSALLAEGRIALQLSTTVSQASAVVASSASATGIRLSAALEQPVSLVGDAVWGVRLGASVYADSVVSAAIAVGFPLYSTIVQPSAVLGAIADTTAIRLASEIDAPATLSATLTGTSTAASEAILEQDSALSASMVVAVPAGPSLLEQASALQVALKVSIPIQAEAEQQTEVSSALQTPLRLVLAISQGSELSESTLEVGKRFNTIIATQNAVEIDLEAPRFVGQADSSLAQESELLAGLKVSIRFQALLPQPQATLLAIPKANRALKLAPIQNAGLVQSVLRVPAVGSTGWLTVSDIFFHNDYYSEVVFEQVPASEIALVPALRIDTLSIMPA
jgi:hypothetical protein